MMKHLTEEQLVFHYYGEVDASEASVHLATCEHCRESYQALQRVLNSVDSLPVPERGADYEAKVWQCIALRLEPNRPWYLSWNGWRPLAMAGSMAALLVASFLAGRVTRSPAEPARVADAAQARERVLLVALGAHLERTKMMLVELTNAQPEDGQFDISMEQEAANRLLDANRLYRQTAMNTGNYQVTVLLEELERVMVELAHSPTSIPEAQLEDLRQRMEDSSLLFKVKIFSSQFESRGAAPPASNSRSL